jgi:hypothetical protein
VAQKVEVKVVCDLHEGEVEAVGAVPFALDGSSYELDACEEHAAQMRDAFAPYVGAARRADRDSAPSAARRSSRGSSRPSSSGGGGASDREQVQAKREWARANGFTVNDRGRLSGEVLRAYDAAH